MQIMRSCSLKLFVVFFSLFAVNAWAINVIEGVRIWPAPENTRVVFDLSDKPDYSYFYLSSPNRLVIDFKNTQNISNLSNLAKNDTRIKLIRTSTSKNNSAVRLVLELNSNYDDSIFVLAPTGPYGDRLVVDLLDKNVTLS